MIKYHINNVINYIGFITVLTKMIWEE